MKHVIVFAILAVTIPLFAAEKKDNAAPPAAPAQVDSPLVAAAKRAGRLNKKPSFVITNETLAQMNGGRLSVATGQQPEIVMPAPLPASAPTPEMAARDRAAQEASTRATMAAEQQKVQQQRTSKAAQRANQYQDESYLDDDPAAAEHALEQMTRQGSKTPEQTQKPPQN